MYFDTDQDVEFVNVSGNKILKRKETLSRPVRSVISECWFNDKFFSGEMRIIMLTLRNVPTETKFLK